MVRSPSLWLWSLVLAVAGLPRWLLAACIMLLTLISSDFNSEASAHPPFLSGSALSALVADDLPVDATGQASKAESQSLPRLFSAITGSVVLAMAQSSHLLRAESLQRGRNATIEPPYVLLLDWALPWVVLLLCGLGLCLALLYQRHVFRDRFGRFSAAFWNRKHLQYRFTHTAA